MVSSLRTIWNRLAERVPLTWEGSFLLFVSGVVLWFLGIQLEDWILLVLGSFGVLLVVLSSLSVAAASLFLKWRLRKLNEGRSHPAILTDTSKPAISGFLLPRFVPPFIDFFGEWEFPKVEIATISLFPDLTEEVFFSKRGRFDNIIRVFEVRDLFGLAAVKWRMTEQREMEVWPQEHPHPPPFVRSFADGDDMFVPNRPRAGDRVDIRQYQPGDSVRLIHWKLFARSNEPFIRIPESSASFERQVMAFLVSDEDDEFAAQSVRFDLEHGHFGRKWLFGADRGEEIASTIHIGRKVLALSGVRPPRYGADLPSFLEKVDFKAEQHRLILYASGTLHRWLPTMEPMLRKYAAVTMLIIANQLPSNLASWETAGTNKHTEPTAKTWWETWQFLFLKPEEDKSNQVDEPWDTLRQLMAEGLQVQMLEPPDTKPSVQRMSSSFQNQRGHRASPRRKPIRGVPPPNRPFPQQRG